MEEQVTQVVEASIETVSEAVEQLQSQSQSQLQSQSQPQPQPKKVIIIRSARLADLPQLEDLLVEFYETQKKRGNKTLANNPDVLRGGVMAELSMNWLNPNCKIMVADKSGELLGFFIAEIVNCRPIEEYHRAAWIRGDYVIPRINSLLRPVILKKMWSEIHKWSVQNGVSYFYGDIHQSNQPSIKTAKSVGFKHYLTRFMKLVDTNGG